MDLYIACAQALGYKDCFPTSGADGVVDRYYVERAYPKSRGCNHLALMDDVVINGKSSKTLNTWMTSMPEKVYRELCIYLEEAHGMRGIASTHGENNYAVISHMHDRAQGRMEFKMISPRRSKYELFFEVFLDFMEYINAKEKKATSLLSA